MIQMPQRKTDMKKVIIRYPIRIIYVNFSSVSNLNLSNINAKMYDVSICIYIYIYTRTQGDFLECSPLLLL